MIYFASSLRTVPICIGLMACSGQGLQADNLLEESATGAASGYKHSSSHASKGHFKKECCHDLLMASSIDAPDIILAPFPTPTPVPFVGAPLVIQGDSLCQWSDTSFLIKEAGYYLLEATVYAANGGGEAIDSGFAFQAMDCNGRILYTGDRAISSTDTLSTITIRQIYRVSCAVPQLLQLVGYLAPTGPATGLAYPLAAGRSVSLSIVKLCGDLSRWSREDGFQGGADGYEKLWLKGNSESKMM